MLTSMVGWVGMGGGGSVGGGGGNVDTVSMVE